MSFVGVATGDGVGSSVVGGGSVGLDVGFGVLKNHRRRSISFSASFASRSHSSSKVMPPADRVKVVTSAVPTTSAEDADALAAPVVPSPPPSKAPTRFRFSIRFSSSPAGVFFAETQRRHNNTRLAWIPM
jgi:hypothetical protein